jgi:hypothetical protein
VISCPRWKGIQRKNLVFCVGSDILLCSTGGLHWNGLDYLVLDKHMDPNALVFEVKNAYYRLDECTNNLSLLVAAGTVRNMMEKNFATWFESVFSNFETTCPKILHSQRHSTKRVRWCYHLLQTYCHLRLIDGRNGENLARFEESMQIGHTLAGQARPELDLSPNSYNNPR